MTMGSMKNQIMSVLMAGTFIFSSSACLTMQQGESDTPTVNISSSDTDHKTTNPSLGSLSYLRATDVSIANVIPPMPPADSDTDKVDNGVLHLMQSSRSASECARALTEVTISLDSFMGPAYGPLTAAEVTQLSALFNTLILEAKYFSGQAKLTWKRPRPYIEDKSLTPCVKPENSTAYPSGHATVARVFAQILKTIYPDRAPKFMARADQIALDRALGGVHHPSDLLAGQKLADAIAVALLQNDKFKNALTSAKGFQN